MMEDSLPNLAFVGDLQGIRRMLAAGADIEQHNGIGQTALHNAIEQRNIPIIEFLLDSGADIEGETEGGWSPLIHALDIETDAAHQLRRNEPYTEILHLLIARGVDVNRRAGFGQTPLQFAIRLGNHVARKILLEAGATLEEVREPQRRSFWIRIWDFLLPPED